VRAYPASRRHPQFNKANLRAFLEGASIAYRWEGKALGGMRPSYADHMQTEQFQSAARSLSQTGGRVCIMCAESNPADCHRSLIADWLVAHGERVTHLLDAERRQEHPGRLI
jgi:uncharacterized protein (DUF488 family)